MRKGSNVCQLLLAAAIMALVLLGNKLANAETLTLPAALPVDGGPLGQLKVQGILSGLATAQSNATSGDQSQRFDVDNAQLILQKDSGKVQFLVQGGAYTFPVVGVPFTDTPDAVKNLFGPVPVAYIKFVPSDSVSVQVGKLPALLGAEGAWSWGNYNIERGLLWNMENTVTRGVQFNYSKDAINVSLAWTDGFYSNRFDNLTAQFAYTASPSDTWSVVAYEPLQYSAYASTATPVALNNARIYNLIYSHSAGPWVFQPYLQYDSSPASQVLGFSHENDAFGAAFLADYSFNELWSLGARLEYATSSGAGNSSANNNLLGYGPGSHAWSLTLTPLWQRAATFVRAEISYVKITNGATGMQFGAQGDASDQIRALLEFGLTF